jgi:predicted nucleic acid-binding Zn ribbon protein
MKRPRKETGVERTLRAWRPTMPSELASLATDSAQPARQLVTAALGQLKLGEQANEAEVLAAWSEIVGPVLAKHSIPGALRNGLLTVGVTNPAIQQELRGLLKRDILARLQKRFGARRVRDINFRVIG